MKINLSKSVIITLAFVSAGSGALWFQDRNTRDVLRASIANVEKELASSTSRQAEQRSDLERINSAVVAKEQAVRASPETLEASRTAATLAVINQIRAKRQVKPTQAKQKPPPMGPNGQLFPDLLKDPEYSKLYVSFEAQLIRSGYAPEFRQLGLNEAEAEKAVAILAEDRVAVEEFRALSGGRTTADFTKQQAALTDKQLLELMGEERFQKWKTLTEVHESAAPTETVTLASGVTITRTGLPREALVSQASSYLTGKLGLRLSYSETPLQKEQADRLAEALVSQASGEPLYIYRTMFMFTDSFVEQAKSILTPTQVQALREFQAEQEASNKRSKLPKSSELPRNQTPKS
ncbi:MAG: hypothetical protein QM790_15560 [Nibricoccus sp.]